MTMTKIRKARSLAEVESAIERLEDINHASMSAKTQTYSVDGGRAPADEVRMLNNLITEEPVYVVFSYNTPIAWMGMNSRQPYFAARRYSQTTARHQGLALRALMSAVI